MAKNKQHPQDRGGFVSSGKGNRPPLNIPLPTASSRVGNRNKPVLVITGIAAASAAVIAVGMLCTDPADPVIEVERAQYATREACLDDWNNPADCQQIDDDMDAASQPDVTTLASMDGDGANTTTTTTGGHSGGSHSGWYGPYYTRSGTIYHNNGLQTTGELPATVHGRTSSLSVRGTSLYSGSSVFNHSPGSVSRGGFMSGHGGEGGGHGFGGSRGG